MYRIQTSTGAQWTIVDEREEVVFVGTLRECEDWLDFQENAQRKSRESRGWLSQLWRWFRRQPAAEMRQSARGDEKKTRDAGPGKPLIRAFVVARMELALSTCISRSFRNIQSRGTAIVSLFVDPELMEIACEFA